MKRTMSSACCVAASVTLSSPTVVATSGEAVLVAGDAMRLSPMPLSTNRSRHGASDWLYETSMTHCDGL